MSSENGTQQAIKPFEFFTAAHLTRIGNQIAGSLAEMVTCLDHCSDASIFHHTFQTLGTHHFLTEGFSNDFAQWVYAATNRAELAEQLAALDVRDYVSLAELRRDLRRMVADYCRDFPQFSEQRALECFYFCEGVEATTALSLPPASNLTQFRDGLSRISHASFHFHFISSRLRLQLKTNDFSQWLADSLGKHSLASHVNRIDIYTNTLDSARSKILRLIDREIKLS
ncbi:MAG TPA: DUF5752 family protein [Candidatus Acidoferrales bacterium]|nr:DUF5752 family protein [Candidatus Acidoferrales bacterium]